MLPLGHQLLLDFWDLPAQRLDDPVELRQALVAAATRGGAQVVEARFHRFEPHGVSGFLVLAESHLALHTWPERGYAALDIFTCGEPEVGRRIAQELERALQPGRVAQRSLERGATPAEASPATTPK